MTDNDAIAESLGLALAIYNDYWRLLCSQCGQVMKKESTRISREEAGVAFRVDGWRIVNGLPICPSCVKVQDRD
jgi:hypothetical protein